MTEKTKIIIAEARKLSCDERAEIVYALIESLDELDPDVDAAWFSEAKDRLAAYRRGELKAVDFDEQLAKHAKS